MRTDIPSRVREIIAAMAPSARAANPDGADTGTLCGTARLSEDLGFESVRLIELTMVLERSFGLAAMPPEELAGVRRVDDVVALIGRHVDAGTR